MSKDFSGKTIIVSYGSTMSVEQRRTAKTHGWTVLPEAYVDATDRLKNIKIPHIEDIHPSVKAFADKTDQIAKSALFSMKREVDSIMANTFPSPESWNRVGEIFKNILTKVKPSDTGPEDTQAMNDIEGRK
jgi:transcription antitermination factor NusA-like protein